MSSDIDMGSESRRASIAKYVDALSGLIGLIVFTRYLGVEGVGLYYILSAIAMLCTRPAVGIATANEHYISSETGDSRVYMSSTILLGLLFNSVLALAIVILQYTFGILSVFSPPEGSVFALTVLIILSALHQTGRSGYSGAGYPSATTFISAVRGIIETSLQIIALVVFGYGVPALLIGTGIAAVASFSYFVSRPAVNIGMPTLESCKKLISYGKWSMLTSISVKLYTRIDELIIGFVIGSGPAGIYSAAKRLVNPVSIVGFGIKRTILVSVSQYVDVTDELMDEFNLLGGYASILGMPIIFGSFIIGENLLSVLYGVQYAEGHLVLIASSIYFTLFSHSSVLSEFLNGIEKPKHASGSIVLATAIRAVLGGVFVFYYGLNGIIPAILVSAVIRIIYLVYAIRRETGYVYKPKLIKSQFVSSLVMLAVVAVVSMVSLSTTITVILTIFSGGVSYMVCLLYIDRESRSRTKKILSRINN
jgi:O-antigen/teichoic acid export membrane protein